MLKATSTLWLLDIGNIKLMKIYVEQGYVGVPQWAYFHLENTSCYADMSTSEMAYIDDSSRIAMDAFDTEV